MIGSPVCKLTWVWLDAGRASTAAWATGRRLWCSCTGWAMRDLKKTPKRLECRTHKYMRTCMNMPVFGRSYSIRTWDYSCVSKHLSVPRSEGERPSEFQLLWTKLTTDYVYGITNREIINGTNKHSLIQIDTSMTACVSNNLRVSEKIQCLQTSEPGEMSVGQQSARKAPAAQLLFTCRRRRL